MSQTRCFSLLGDSNVSRNLTKTTLRSNPVLKLTQIIPCGHIGLFSEALKNVRAESSVCIVACLTNFLTSSDGNSSVASRVEPVLQQIVVQLHEACVRAPNCFFVVSAPMYRTTPVWYRDGMAEVLILFSQSLTQNRPANLQMMPSFATPDLESDGVHLTPFSALQYLNHLFDSSDAILDGLSKTTEQVLLDQCEVGRLLDDRVTALEQDHKRLNRVVENKIAVDSELADMRENERKEDCFTIEGLPLIPPEIVGKAWQELAIKHVQEVLVPLMGKELSIIVVQNVTNRHEGAEVKYCVKMASAIDSGAIRRKFGSFFIGGDKRPEQFKPYSIRNWVTPETKVRIEILKVLGKRYRDANPGSRVQVIGFAPRPLLKITPSSSASDRRVKSYNFIEAIRYLPTNFTTAEVVFLLKKIPLRMSGKLRSLFIVLSDDDFRRRNPRPQQATDASTEVDVRESTSDSGTSGSDPSSRKRAASSSSSSSAPKR